MLANRTYSGCEESMTNGLKNHPLGQYNIQKRQLQRKKTARLNRSIESKPYLFPLQIREKLFKKTVSIMVWIEFLLLHISECALQRQRFKENFCLSKKDKRIWVSSLLQFCLVSMALKTSSMFPFQPEGFEDRY